MLLASLLSLCCWRELCVALCADQTLNLGATGRSGASGGAAEPSAVYEFMVIDELEMMVTYQVSNARSGTRTCLMVKGGEVTLFVRVL